MGPPGVVFPAVLGPLQPRPAAARGGRSLRGRVCRPGPSPLALTRAGPQKGVVWTYHVLCRMPGTPFTARPTPHLQPSSADSRREFGGVSEAIRPGLESSLSCVTPAKSLNLSVPHCPPLCHGDYRVPSRQGCQEVNTSSQRSSQAHSKRSVTGSLRQQHLATTPAIIIQAFSAHTEYVTGTYSVFSSLSRHSTISIHSHP